MNWKLKYSKLKDEINEKLKDSGMQIKFADYENLSNPEGTCRALMSLSAKMEGIKELKGIAYKQ